MYGATVASAGLLKVSSPSTNCYLNGKLKIVLSELPGTER